MPDPGEFSRIVVGCKRAIVVFSWTVPLLGLGVVAIFVGAAAANHGAMRALAIALGIAFGGVAALAFRGAFRISRRTVADAQGLLRLGVFRSERIAYDDVVEATESVSPDGVHRKLQLLTAGGENWEVSSVEVNYKAFLEALSRQGIHIVSVTQTSDRE